MPSFNRHYLLRAVCCIALLLLAWSPVPAQTTSGIRGTVTDASLAALAGANVTVKNLDTGLTTASVTDNLGSYTFQLLPVGRYSLQVEAKGFKPVEQSSVRLSTNEVADLNFSLEVGSVSEQVQVLGEAPVINTETSETSTLISTKNIVDLPLNGRNVIQLATLTNGVAAEKVPTAIVGGDERNASSMSVDGNRVTMTQYNLDGGEFASPQLNSGLNYPNPDAIQEFRFITGNYSAEFGRNPGGVMNVITRSGTNDFHGSAWEFNRNSGLAARSFFLPNVAFLNQNQFGFSAGGPVLKNKLFLFGSGQWLRIRQGRATTSGIPPTPAEESGDFSALGVPIHDPTTGVPFPNNQVPASMLDPVALKLAALLPSANSPSGYFLGSFPEPVNNYQYFVRGDYNISSRNRLSVSWFHDDTVSTSALDFGRLTFPFQDATGPAGKSSTTDIKQAVANWTTTISPTLLNQVRFSYVGVDLTSSAAGRGPTLNTLTSAFPAQPLQDIPGFVVSGFFSQGTGNFNVYPSVDYQFSDSVSYVLGRNNLKVGVEYRHWDDSFTSTANNMGIFIATGSATGNALSDFFLGNAVMYVSNAWQSDSVQQGYAGYVQDDFKVSRNLVLNLGLRYQVDTAFEPKATVKDTDGSYLRPAGGFSAGVQSTVFPTAPPGLVYPGDPGVSPGVIPTDFGNVAPRLGFAWDITGNGKTSLRAGYGLFYSAPNASDITSSTQNPPYFVNFFVSQTPSFVNPLPQLGSAFPITYSKDLNFANFYPMSIQSLALNFHNARIQQWNITLQQELPGHITAQAAWVGNHSGGLLYFKQVNTPVYIPGNDASGQALSTVSNENNRRPLNASDPSNPIYSAVALGEPIGTSDYDALQVQVRKEFSHGLDLLASYTFARAIDTSSVQLSCAFGGSAPAQNPNLGINADRGLANFDQRQRLVLSVTYETPSVTKALHLQNRLAGILLDKWEVGTIASFASGFPFTVVTGTDNSLTGVGDDRPNLIGNPYLSTSRPRSQLISEYFNTAAFAPNAMGAFGDLGRNTLIGPGSVSVDMALFKTIPISERWGHLQLRLEAFNAPNRPNFANPSAILTSPSSFGKITSAGPGRVVQIGAKYIF